MRILQLGKLYPLRGGVEKVMYDLATGLCADGVECDMLTASWRGRGFTEPIGENGRLMCCHSWTKAYATMVAPSMVTRLRATCGDYDIIHVHHPDPMACIALRLSGYKGKVVCHWHSDILKQKRLLRLYAPLQDWLLRRADVIVGTSPVYVAETPYLQDVREKTVVLPIGVDPIAPDAAVVDSLRAAYGGRKIVFSLGRLVPYNGYRYLVETARMLGDDYVVLIGGSGPLRGELQASIDRMGLSGRVRLLGRISDAELPAYYGACSLFCLPSVMKTEAFGIVQIEAMSCGRPVVATTIPGSGVSWVNAHGVSGLNVAPANAEELAVAIRAVTADAARWQRFSDGARRRYEEIFTKDKMIKEVHNIYNDLWKGQK